MTLYPIAKGRRAVGWSVPATRSFTVLADELRRPRGLARASDGTLYVSAEGSAGRVTTATTTRRTTTRPTSTDADDDDDARRPSSVGTIFRWSAGTGFQVVARAFKHPDGLVWAIVVDMMGAIHAGSNALQVTVINLWPNRRTASR